MTIKRMLIGGQQLAVDDETGELIIRDLFHIADSKIKPGVVTVTADWKVLSTVSTKMRSLELTALAGNTNDIRYRAVGDTGDGGILAPGAKSKEYVGVYLHEIQIKGMAGDQIMYDGEKLV